MITPVSINAPSFKLRDAEESDYLFTERLYIQTMKPLLVKLDAWDETDVINKFNGHYNLSQVQIIVIGDQDVGWLQIDETEQVLELAQIHIIREFCCQGIGTQLIRALMDEARNKGKSVFLSVVRGNRALSLYQRLGFCVIDEDEHKLHLRWDTN